jgi:DNA-binding transcriptional ArsR family regulator
VGRKSTIRALPDEVRRHIERRLREGRLTLDALIEDLREQFPGAEHPSRSALGRYSQHYDELSRRLREQEAMAQLLVSELGENPDERARALLVQSITALTTHAAFAAQGDDDIAIDDVRKLARAARDVLHARRASLDERRQIEQAAREAVLAEQADKLDTAIKANGLSADTAAALRRQILGVGDAA